MVNRNNAFKTPSYTSPKGGSRGCLCPDGTYSRKCCDGSLQAQGIGNIYGQTYFLLKEDGFQLLQENGFKLLQENAYVSQNNILLENGFKLLQQNNYKILKENG
jgi:hypothetical protein